MVNFYRRFLPGIARTLQPLTDVLKGAPKTLEWPPAAAFGAAKAALAAAVPLAHPAPNAVLSVATDTSDTHIGGVLQQLNGGRWQPLVFYSKKLSGAGTRYSTFDRELLAAFSAVRHFRFLLEGRQFRLLTDHKPLVTSLFCITLPWSACQQRQLSFIAEFTSDIRHTLGQENVVADALSRPPSAAAQRPPPGKTTSPALAAEDWPEEGLVAPEQPIFAAIADAQPIYFSAMAAAQRSCPEVAEMTNSTTLQITSQAVRDETLLGDVSTGVFRPLVPIQHREVVFQSLHTIHHPGVQATRRLIAARFCWPQMAKDITLMARACLHCQQGKVRRHVHLHPAEIPVPHRRFAHIHVNLVGPLPPSRGHTYLFTIIDRTSRWPEAIPLSSITAADYARALFAGWVSRFEVPATITSDIGAHFMSALWAGLCSLLNIQPTSSTHPRQHTTRNQTDWSSGSTGS
jgi:cleavage and polyadenylation specificity factor subunit 1